MRARFGSHAKRVAALVLALAAVPSDAPLFAQPPATSCPASLVAGAHDYHGLALRSCSFAGQDLSNANFQGATLTSVNFIRTQLTGADFSGAIFADSADATFPNDFSFADLTDAKFIGAQFDGPTYLTYATLPCADFSKTSLTNGNAIFGDQPLAIATTRSCRTAFQNTTMSCEFLAQWDQLDLTGANLSACASQLVSGPGGTGHDFSGGMYGGVVFDGLDLTGSKWTGAVLERASFQGATLDNATGLQGISKDQKSRLSAARFNNASVQNVDLSHAELYGAQFINANLSNSSLAGSSLQANAAATPPIDTAAVFDGAHLRNVNLANADLEGASFKYASFYSSFNGATPMFPCQTGCGSPNFTCACATASGATLTAAKFFNAFLYGVDFTGTTRLGGAQFDAAILTGASFSGAQFGTGGDAAPSFNKALLQGTTFDAGADLFNAVFVDAFVDFGIDGSGRTSNDLYLQLSADYTRFRGWSGAAKPCVLLPYGSLSAVPAGSSMTCPNSTFAVCGSGGTPASRALWKGSIAMGANTPVPGWYAFDTTYDKAGGNPASCTFATKDPNW